MANGIPGFEQALERERSERNLAYLNPVEIVCGHRVRQVTPLLLCKLLEARSPFMCGGSYGYPHVVQFLCILGESQLTTETAFLEEQRRLFAALVSIPLHECEKQISEFLGVTFRDQPSGKKDGAPIASSVAWLEYRMTGEPWKWTREQTLNTPLRIIYQQIRCWQKEQGESVVNNLSHKAKAEWLKQLQAAIDSGEITPENVAAFQEQQFKLHSRN